MHCRRDNYVFYILPLHIPQSLTSFVFWTDIYCLGLLGFLLCSQYSFSCRDLGMYILRMKYKWENMVRETKD
jgi:hypothetical protein